MEVVDNTDAFNDKIALVVELSAIDMENVKDKGEEDLEEVSLLSQLIRKITSWANRIPRMDSNWSGVPDQPTFLRISLAHFTPEPVTNLDPSSASGSCAVALLPMTVRLISLIGLKAL